MAAITLLFGVGALLYAPAVPVRRDATVRARPAMLMRSWLYPKAAAYVELPPVPQFAPPVAYTPLLARLHTTFEGLAAGVLRRSNLAAELAAIRRAMPSLRQRDLRSDVVFGLVRCELEETGHFFRDLLNASLVIDYTSGRLDTSFIEQKVAGLVDRHNRRWPLVSWLLGPDYDPTLALLSEDARLERRGRELREAVTRLFPAVVGKIKSAIRRDPKLLLPVFGRVLAASGLIGLYQAAQVARPIVSAQRIFGLMNAFLVQVASLLKLTQLPTEERLVDFGFLEDLVADALAEPASRLELALRRPQFLTLGMGRGRTGFRNSFRFLGSGFDGSARAPPASTA